MHIILCLKFYLRQLFGDHYPIEIVKHIVMILYKPIKISCGQEDMAILIDDNIYIWNNREMSCDLVRRHILSQHVVLKSVKKMKIDNNNNMIFLTSNGNVYEWKNNMRIQEFNIRSLHYPSRLSTTPKINKINKIYYCNSGGFIVTENESFDFVDSGKLVPSNILMPIKKIKLGLSYTVLLTKNGSLFGYHSFGQSESQYITYRKMTTVTHIIKFDCSKSHIIILTKNNKIYVWGENKFGQLGLGDNCDRFSPHELSLAQVEIVSVRCGDAHTIILAKNDQIYACGWNRYGQLGLGHTDNSYYPQKISFSILGITKIYCGTNYTCALTILGKIYVWGKKSGHIPSKNNNGKVSCRIDSIPTELKF